MLFVYDAIFVNKLFQGIYHVCVISFETSHYQNSCYQMYKRKILTENQLFSKRLKFL